MYLKIRLYPLLLPPFALNNVRCTVGCFKKIGFSLSLCKLAVCTPLSMRVLQHFLLLSSGVNKCCALDQLKNGIFFLDPCQMFKTVRLNSRLDCYIHKLPSYFLKKKRKMSVQLSECTPTHQVTEVFSSAFVD